MDELPVQLARIEGRLDGAERALGRLEQACERRASTHVDRELYSSERDTMRAGVDGLRREIVGVRDNLRELEQAQDRARKWWIASVVIPVVALAVTLVGVVA